jgi:hypothetical protein
MRIFTARGSSGAAVSSAPHRCEPGITSVAPLLSVKPSEAQFALTATIGCGRGTRTYASS